MLQHSLGKEDVLSMAQTMIAELDPKAESDRSLMTKGLQLYREGRVYNVSFNGFVLEGTVEDETGVYDSALPISDAAAGSCDCFEIDYCEHQAAVLFYAASSFGQVGEISKLFKEKGKPPQPQLKTARQLLQASAYDELDFDSWLRYFDQEFTSFRAEQNKYSYRKMYYLMSIFEDFYMKLLRKAPRSAALRELFALNASLFSFERLLEAAEQYAAEQTYSYFSPTAVAHRFIDEVEMRIEKIKTEDFPPAIEPLLKRTSDLTHSLFFSHTLCLQERFFLYRYLWTDVLNQSNWLTEEQTKLEEMEPSLLRSLALSHVFFLHQKDAEAMELLSEESDMLVGFYFYWVEELCAELQWDRVEQWLSFSYKKLKQYLVRAEEQFLKNDIVRLFLSSYEYYVRHTNDTGGFETILQELLPHSLWQYEAYLIARGQYRTWAELRMFVGFETLEGLKEALKEVEKEDREAVLPLYHQGVIDAIGMKNRQAYKLAVRYLKKLRTHYKKLKRTEEWNVYITQLASSFSRLRAFQEELRKGKLLDET